MQPTLQAGACCSITKALCAVQAPRRMRAAFFAYFFLLLKKSRSPKASKATNDAFGPNALEKRATSVLMGAARPWTIVIFRARNGKGYRSESMGYHGLSPKPVHLIRRCAGCRTEAVDAPRAHLPIPRPIHHATIASLNRRVKSSAVAGRGESLVTRCWGSVPLTSAGMSLSANPMAASPLGTSSRFIRLTI